MNSSPDDASDFKDMTDSAPVAVHSPDSPEPQDEEADDDSKMEVIAMGGAWKAMVVNGDKDPPPPEAELVELDLEVDNEPLQGKCRMPFNCRYKRYSRAFKQYVNLTHLPEQIF